MRLWHQALIDKLPRQQLLGQHRECAAFRGGRVGRSTVWLTMPEHSPYKLYAYHRLILRKWSAEAIGLTTSGGSPAIVAKLLKLLPAKPSSATGFLPLCGA